MINLTRINRAPVVLNSDLIEYIERTPDTVVSLTNGLKLLVLETPNEIVSRVIDFRRRILDNFSGEAVEAAAVSKLHGAARLPATKSNKKEREE